jgi:glycosyltransferase involved in cell wall biosynthesis
MRYTSEQSSTSPRVEQYMMGAARKPLVTITISTYNSEVTIDDVLNSLLQQDYPLKLIEVIVVDGHSIDETVNKVRKFMEEHGNKFYDFKLIVHDRNYGVSKARNDGIKLARGEYIMILDSDVILPPNAISKMISFLNHNPKVGCCSALLKGNATDFVSQWRFELNIGKIRKIVTCADAAMIKREVIEKAGLYDESMGPPFSVDEDMEFAARIWRAGYQCVMLGDVVAKHAGIKRDRHLLKIEGRREAKNYNITMTTYLKVLKGHLSIKDGWSWYKFLRALPFKLKLKYIISSLFLLCLMAFFLTLLISTYPIVYMTLLAALIFIFLNTFVDFASNLRNIHKSTVLTLLACINRSARSVATSFYLLTSTYTKYFKTHLCRHHAW